MQIFHKHDQLILFYFLKFKSNAIKLDLSYTSQKPRAKLDVQNTNSDYSLRHEKL